MADKHKTHTELVPVYPQEDPENEPDPISNLATPTFFSAKIKQKRQFFSDLNIVADKNGSKKIPRKLLYSSRGYPYRLARLVDYNGDLSKKWYIVFYAWDIGLKKLRRKRVLKDDLEIGNKKHRYKIAYELIDDINEQLRTGSHLESKRPEEKTKALTFYGYKLIDALNYVKKHKEEIEKMSRSTVKAYDYTTNTMRDFMRHEQIDEDILLTQFNKDFYNRYCIYLRTVTGIGNKTYNDRITNLHSAFEVLRNLDDRLWPKGNPVKVKKLSVVTKTHAAYTKEQLAKFIELIEPQDPQLLLFIRFIYYTLARPNELRFLKVGHIYPQYKKIMIDGSSSKTDIEKYVGISQAFQKLIDESGILKYPPSYYVFSTDQRPGPVKTGLNYFSKRFRPYMVATGFKDINDRYSMYGFKHSGAVQLYLETKDVAIVQRQCRHTSISQTTTYLTDLGVFVDFAALAGWKGF